MAGIPAILSSIAAGRNHHQALLLRSLLAGFLADLLAGLGSPGGFPFSLGSGLSVGGLLEILAHVVYVGRNNLLEPEAMAMCNHVIGLGVRILRVKLANDLACSYLLAISIHSLLGAAWAALSGSFNGCRLGLGAALLGRNHVGVRP